MFIKVWLKLSFWWVWAAHKNLCSAYFVQNTYCALELQELNNLPEEFLLKKLYLYLQKYIYLEFGCAHLDSFSVSEAPWKISQRISHLEEEIRQEASYSTNFTSAPESMKFLSRSQESMSSDKISTPFVEHGIKYFLWDITV